MKIKIKTKKNEKMVLLEDKMIEKLKKLRALIITTFHISSFSPFYVEYHGEKYDISDVDQWLRAFEKIKRENLLGAPRYYIKEVMVVSNLMYKKLKSYQ